MTASVQYSEMQVAIVALVLQFRSQNQLNLVRCRMSKRKELRRLHRPAPFPFSYSSS